jgi:hypothetical protein
VLAHRRRITIAFAASLAAHSLLLLAPVRPPLTDTLLGSAGEVPMTVRIVEAEAPPVVAAAPAPAPEPEPLPPPRPVPAPRPIVPPRVVPKAREPLVPPPPPPTPEPRPAPPMDMSAMIEARRAQRRALEAAARGTTATAEPTPDQLAQATIARNLRTRPGDGVGGVFQILRKSTRTAEFAFNGWRPESDRQWREVIEVDAGLGGDIDRAIVKRMIELIRGHYSGDFRWESHRLGRVVVLSARPEDNEGLEDFLIREFFGTPVLGPGR